MGDSWEVLIAARAGLAGRITRSVVLTLAVALMASGGLHILLKNRSMVSSMQESANSYVCLVAVQLARLVDLYRHSGHHRLEEAVRKLMEGHPDMVKLEVVEVSGHLALEATRARIKVWERSEGPLLEDAWLMDKVRSLQPCSKKTYLGSVPSYVVVAPAVEEWGRHSYSVIGWFSYARVRADLARSAVVTFLILGLGIAAAYWVSNSIARAVTKDLNALRDSSDKLARGEQWQPVQVSSNDEVADLARAFNSMAFRLQSTIGELRHAYEELLTLDQAKEDMLATVSHELKTPMTAIRGYLELLYEGRLGQLPPQALKAVEICQRNLRRLGARLDEMFSVASARRSVLEMRKGEVKLTALVEQVVESFVPRLKEKGIRCTVKVPPDLPPVWGSAEHLERALANLVDNAVKFTGEGGFVTVSARMEDTADGSGVLLVVSDTGIGIPEEHLEKIFDRFYQVDPSSSRRYGGLGLGLALVKSVVEAHEGRVWAESRRMRGASFYVWLPVSGEAREQV